MREIAKNFKIRASAAGKLMTGCWGLSEVQKSELSKLTERKNSNDAKPLTAKMEERLEELEQKQHLKELSQTTKTYLRKYLQDKLYNRRRIVASKHTVKGEIMEDEGLDLIAEHLGLGMILKNEMQGEDEFKKGTPDAVLPGLIIDEKNSWDHETFPLFETDIPNSDYYWQGQVYMDLFDRDHFKLVYVLQNAPEHLIESEARRYCFLNGFDPQDPLILEEFRQTMTYDEVPLKHRIKVFDIERDNSRIEELHERVIRCRQYIDELIKAVS